MLLGVAVEEGSLTNEEFRDSNFVWVERTGCAAAGESASTSWIRIAARDPLHHDAVHFHTMLDKIYKVLNYTNIVSRQERVAVFRTGSRSFCVPL